MAVVKYLYLKEIKISGWLLLVTLNAFLSSAACGDPANPIENSLTELGGLLAKLDNYEGQFTQLIYGPRGQVLQEVEGNFLVKRPNLFKWVVQDPFPQVVVTQGSQLLIYDPDLEQATVRSISSVAVDTPASLLTGNLEQLEAGFKVSRVSDLTDVRQREFRLIPLAQDSLFEELLMKFDSGQLSRLEIVDHMQQITVIQFRNVETNDNLTTADFSFELPPGTDVIGDAISE